jgi:hypothetical protein
MNVPDLRGAIIIPLVGPPLRIINVQTVTTHADKQEAQDDKGNTIGISLEASRTELSGVWIEESTDHLAVACLLAGQTQPGIATCNTAKEKL